LLLVLAWLGAYLTAVPLAVLAAAMRARPLDRALVWAALMPHALPTVALAAILLGASDGLARTSTAAAAAALGVGMVASPLRQQRAQLLAVMQEEWTRAALAQGSSLLGASWRNLRSTLMPVVAQAYLELPAALTACFVIERVFGLEGLGEATIVAVAQGQVGWLMALALLAAAWGAAALVVCDLTCGLIDPRVRASLARLAGRA
jgi:ABC-type dipeptide/oligopeptide/nickel transport system permease component